jgi:hypothetical protein
VESGVLRTALGHEAVDGKRPQERRAQSHAVMIERKFHGRAGLVRTRQEQPLRLDVSYLERVL